MVEPEVVATSPYRIKSPVPVFCGISSRKLVLAVGLGKLQKSPKGNRHGRHPRFPLPPIPILRALTNVGVVIAHPRTGTQAASARTSQADSLKSFQLNCIKKAGKMVSFTLYLHA
jgi:hypothetical protein